MESKLGEQAKQWLVEFVPQMDKWLNKVWEEQSVFGYNDSQRQLAKEMLIHAKAHNLAPSKRIRGAFVYMGYKLGKGVVGEGIWRAAAAIELVHTALLMHDDFMDEDLIRRGKETTNAWFAKKYGRHYGEAMAVTMGDMVLSLGYETLAKCGLEMNRVMAANIHLQRTIFNTAVGQAHDVTLGHLDNWDERDVLAVHQAKTGLYTYEDPLLVGAILAGADEKVKTILKKYAHDGGVAFQLQDDILGVYGDPDKTGKSANSDLLQGKATLLIYGVKKLGNADQVEAVMRVWGKGQVSETDLEAAKEAIGKSGSLDYSREVAKKLARKAAATAAELRELEVDIGAVDFLQGVAEYMVEREV